jgi:hypothetical protein
MPPVQRPEGAPVLTLANAAVELHHEPATPPSLGYSHTMHHSSLIETGDLWRPTAHEYPHVVRSIDHFRDRLTITDEDGQTFHYPSEGLIATAVADAGPVRTHLPPTWKGAAPRKRRGREGGIAEGHAEKVFQTSTTN